MNAIISGATKGIGKAIAFELASLGYSLALGARSEKDLLQVQKELSQLYPENLILIKPCDFSIKVQIDEFASFVKNNIKNINVIVNNVGLYQEGTISEDANGLLENLMNTNLYSAYCLTRHFLHGMKTQKSGHVFNICSVTSLFPRVNAAAYSITKAALLSFSKSLSEEMREYNVKVTAIIPGSVNTSSWDGIDAPKEQFVQADDIAKTIKSCLNMSDYAVVDEIVIRPMNKNF